MTAAAKHPVFALPVVSCLAVGTRQTLLSLDASATEAAASHTVAGQYVHLTLDAIARPYALASPPGAGVFEFLLRVPAARAEALALADDGRRVDASVAMGSGFPMEKAQGRPLWLCATGTGIAPLRSVLLAKPPGPLVDVTLLYGVRSPDDIAFADDLAAFRARGANVVVAVSGPVPPDDLNRGLRRGYVQDHLPDAFDDPRAVAFLVAGSPAMERDLGAALAARGVDATQVHRNW